MLEEESTELKDEHPKTVYDRDATFPTKMSSINRIEEEESKSGFNQRVFSAHSSSDDIDRSGNDSDNTSGDSDDDIDDQRNTNDRESLKLLSKSQTSKLA